MKQVFNIESGRILIAAHFARSCRWFCVLGGTMLGLFYVGCYGVNIPVADGWGTGMLLMKWHESGIFASDLLALHNEHRPVVPRLIYISLAQLTGWDVKMEMFAGVLLVSATLLLMLGTWRREHARSGFAWALGVASLTALLFSWGQWENWLSGIGLHWFVMSFILAATFAVALTDLPVPLRLTGVIVLIIAGCCTVVNGFVSWLAVAPALFVPLRKNGAKTAYWAGAIYFVAMGLTVLAYFYNYQSATQKASLLELFHRPLDVGFFYATLLGSPFSGAGMLMPRSLSPWVARWTTATAGVLAFLMFIGLAARSLRCRGQNAPSFLMGVGFGLFGLLTAAVMAVGRANMGIEAAFSSRYVTCTQYLYVGIIFMICGEIGQNNNRKYKVVGNCALLLLIVSMAVVYCRGNSWGGSMRRAHGRLKAVLQLIEIFPPQTVELMRITHVDNGPGLVKLVDMLDRIGFMRPPLFRDGVIPVAAVQEFDPSIPAGNVDAIHSENASMSAIGWSWLPGRMFTSDAVLVGEYASGERIKLLGISDEGRLHRPDVARRFGVPALFYSGWQLSVPVPVQTNKLIFMAYDAQRNKLCKLNSAR